MLLSLCVRKIWKSWSKQIFFVLSDGSIDAAIVEKGCIYIPFVDPDEFKPKLLFFALEEPMSQDADGLYDIWSLFACK